MKSLTHGIVRNFFVTHRLKTTHDQALVIQLQMVAHIRMESTEVLGLLLNNRSTTFIKYQVMRKTIQK